VRTALAVRGPGRRAPGRCGLTAALAWGMGSPGRVDPAAAGAEHDRPARTSGSRPLPQRTGFQPL